MLNPNRIRQMIIAAVLAATALGLFMGSLIPTAHAAGIVVNSTDDTMENKDDSCTLREAIINANDNAQTWADCAGGSGADTITFASDLNSIILTDDLPDITGELTINGRKGLSLQVINGNDQYQVFYMSEDVIFNLYNVSVTNGLAIYGAAIENRGVTSVSGCRFSNNNATNGGGAIHSAGVLTLTNSTFTGNNAVSSGGATALGGKATVSGSNFISNTASDGGALASGGGEVAVTGSTFTGNSATDDGGAIAVWKGGAITPTMTITGSIFTGNHADGFGGGIYNNKGIIMVTTGVFTANTGDRGGAINNWMGNFMVAGSTFANNSAANQGGAIYAGDVFTVTNSTITNNSAITNGGAIFQSGNPLLVDHSTFSGNGGPDALYGWWDGDFTMRHSLIANSTGANCEGTLTDGGYNLQYGGTDPNSCGASIETANPQLGPLADNGGDTPTMALPEGSPALNRIPGADGCGVGVTVDQRGVSRPQPTGGLCDIGAYEKIVNVVFLPVVLK